jgi:DNA-binding CsgD family transcriptional regulator
MVALTVLGKVQARRGSAEAATSLDEALALAERTGHLSRLGPVRAARAEAALLGGDGKRAWKEAMAVRDLVFTRRNSWLQGELAWLLWQAGDRDVPTDDLAEPYALQIGGDYVGAAAAWRELGCPYQEACALVETEDPDLLLQATAIFEELGANPARAHATRRLRALGVRAMRRHRPERQPATSTSPQGLTARELEVLGLLAAGRTDREIADTLYISPRTASKHVGAILAKLAVASRAEAAVLAVQRSLI